MRLIDADALIAKVSQQGIYGSGYDDSERENDVINMIDEMPTIQAMKYGKWIKCTDRLPEDNKEVIAYNGTFNEVHKQ